MTARCKTGATPRSPSYAELTPTFRDIREAALGTSDEKEIAWALVGGQALVAHGVPRTTLDADIFVPTRKLEDLAMRLVEDYQWTPLGYSNDAENYVEAKHVQVLHMTDPVLFDSHVERKMIALRSPWNVIVELLAAQHRIEREVLWRSSPCSFLGVRIPLAPLGSILLLKAKANRAKDLLAIHQVAEHLPRATLDAAVHWAEKRDASTAEDLAAIIDEVKLLRRVNSSREARSRRRRQR